MSNSFPNRSTTKRSPCGQTFRIVLVLPIGHTSSYTVCLMVKEKDGCDVERGRVGKDGRVRRGRERQGGGDDNWTYSSRTGNCCGTWRPRHVVRRLYHLPPGRRGEGYCVVRVCGGRWQRHGKEGGRQCGLRRGGACLTRQHHHGPAS